MAATQRTLPEWTPDEDDVAFLARGLELAHHQDLEEDEQQQPHSANPTPNADDIQWITSRALAQSSVAIVARKTQTSTSATSPTPPQTYFFKRACVADLQRKSPRNPDAKWRVTFKSFENEQTFLASPVVNATLQAHGLAIPTVVALDKSSKHQAPSQVKEGEETPPDFAAVFRILQEDLAIGSRCIERRFLERDEAMDVIAWLARFHSAFAFSPSSSSSSKKEAEPFPQTWKLGGWWRKPLRPTVKFDTITVCLVRLSQEFP